MKESIVHVHPIGLLFALVGNPNCGKTALFNRLTGSRQKVANYAGVTVERKEGQLRTSTGKRARILDLPGTNSLYPSSPDERVTCDVLNGQAIGEKKPDVVVCVVDATNLRRGLRLVLGVQRLGLPCLVALNMSDEARARGIDIDASALSKALGVVVVPTVAIKSAGDAALRTAIETMLEDRTKIVPTSCDNRTEPAITEDHQRVQDILASLGLDHVIPDSKSERLDRVLLHPVGGPIILLVVLFLIFQAMFGWAQAPMSWIETGFEWLAELISDALPDHWLRSLLIEGIIAGVGGVVVFLPQILILFFFILVLEESGYLPRAAYLLDRMMGSVGLSGRSFIPLLSSFACAIPGIIAARTIPNARDRLVTIMIAPLMTCSARLPVYTLLISAFIPRHSTWGGLELQGLVMFGLYMAAIFGAMAVAWLLKSLTRSGRQIRPLMMALPTYRLPNPLSVTIGLWHRANIFMKRVGGIILAMTVGLWFLASYPVPPLNALAAPIEYSYAGMLGKWLAVILEPIGFNWQIAIALVPGMAAREVAVSALGTVYALSATGDDTETALIPLLAQQWSVATGMAMLAWYVFAPQCLATLATIKRETGGWLMPLVGAGYMFVLAYGAAWLVYRLTPLLF
uniref:ferrous iron transporter B n=1 Tax=Orrella sp. TaxID=1921583 RepID=UPI004048BDAF